MLERQEQQLTQIEVQREADVTMRRPNGLIGEVWGPRGHRRFHYDGSTVGMFDVPQFGRTARGQSASEQLGSHRAVDQQDAALRQHVVEDRHHISLPDRRPARAPSWCSGSLKTAVAEVGRVSAGVEEHALA